MNHKKIRIAKLLANYNHGSRREIERLIEENKIKLNNETVISPATFADETDKIFINGKLDIFKKSKLIFKFYKPKDIICSKRKQDDRKIIYEIIDSKFKNFILDDEFSKCRNLLTHSSDLNSKQLVSGR